MKRQQRHIIRYILFINISWKRSKEYWSPETI